MTWIIESIMIHPKSPPTNPAVFLASRPALSLSLACVFRGTFENRRCSGVLERERGERKKPFLTLPDVFLSMFCHLHGQLSVQGQNVDVQMIWTRLYMTFCLWWVRSYCTIFKAPRSTKSKLPVCVNCNRFYRIREMDFYQQQLFFVAMEMIQKASRLGNWNYCKIPSWRMDDFLPKHYPQRSRHPLRFCQLRTSLTMPKRRTSSGKCFILQVLLSFLESSMAIYGPLMLLMCTSIIYHTSWIARRCCPELHKVFEVPRYLLWFFSWKGTYLKSYYLSYISVWTPPSVMIPITLWSKYMAQCPKGRSVRFR